MLCVCKSGHGGRGGWREKLKKFGRRVGSFDSLKAKKVIQEGTEVREGIFMKAPFPVQDKHRMDKQVPQKPISLTPGERCVSLNVHTSLFDYKVTGLGKNCGETESSGAIRRIMLWLFP